MAKPCIRVYADHEHLQSCKTELKNRNNSFRRISQALNLAGNEVRLKILFLLQTEGKMCPCDLSDILDMTVPAISQHLRKLKDAQLVTHERVGQTIFYTIESGNSEMMSNILSLLAIKKEKNHETTE